MSYEQGGKLGCISQAALLGALVVVDAIWGAFANSRYNSDDAAEYLRKAGYSNVKYVDTDTWMVAFRGCGFDQAVGHEFVATGPSGVEEVGVLVCDNLFQGASIRQAD